ncbi:MAG: hypothetical protein ACM3NH_01045 [Candidatus Saccharibacteria bacterium]
MKKNYIVWLVVVLVAGGLVYLILEGYGREALNRMAVFAGSPVTEPEFCVPGRIDNSYICEDVPGQLKVFADRTGTPDELRIYLERQGVDYAEGLTAGSKASWAVSDIVNLRAVPRPVRAWAKFGMNDQQDPAVRQGLKKLDFCGTLKKDPKVAACEVSGGDGYVFRMAVKFMPGVTKNEGLSAMARYSDVEVVKVYDPKVQSVILTVPPVETVSWIAALADKGFTVRQMTQKKMVPIIID